MRKLAPIAALLALTLPASAQQTPEEAFRAFRQIPCRAYAHPNTDPTGDTADLLPQIRDSVRRYVVERGLFDGYPSECNTNAYVEAQCALTPRATIGTAVDSLYAKFRSGQMLPQPHKCGA